MNKRIILMATFLTISTAVATVMAAETKKSRGEILFKDKCEACHLNGDNTINDKTLKKKDLLKAGLKSKNDIVKFLRDNNTSMPKYNKKELPDKDALDIAGYILKTF